MTKTPAAILGSGNIGTDLMIKILRKSEILDLACLVGIDPASDGLARAERMGVSICAEGIEGLLRRPDFADIQVVFDATSAKAHLHHAAVLREAGKQVVDLTPAALGPYVVPVANLGEHLEAPNVNLVTCGGQATIPIVWALSQVAPVEYAEIVASISSRSAGPGTRANIDEFTETTARGIEKIGGAKHGKAIIVLNPAEPPLIMRDTVYCLTTGDDTAAPLCTVPVRCCTLCSACITSRMKAATSCARCFMVSTEVEVSEQRHSLHAFSSFPACTHSVAPHRSWL